ncbi:MAG: WD40/YVTN/BNR-like repeat-containing protein, partial [Acidobacteriota bacterium]
RMAVWRSRDSGESWESLTEGLPEESYQGVLREGLAVDPLEPCGVYVGTTGGSLFQSRDEGEAWSQLAGHLPAIRSVSAAIVV